LIFFLFRKKSFKERIDLNVIKQEVRMEESLRKRLEFICEFCRVKPIIINGNLRTIDKTNLTYLEPHRIIINDITFLAFNYSNDIFIENLNNKIKTLTENNEALNLRVKTLNDTIKEKDNEISFLKSKIHDLKNTIEYWKDKFEKLISFLHDKLHSWYDKDDKYIDVVNEMYEDNVLDDDDIEELDLSKEKDDYKR
jgi:chaperonin cofactor prefoldin